MRMCDITCRRPWSLLIRGGQNLTHPFSYTVLKTTSVLSQKFVGTCSRAREGPGERQSALIRPKSCDFGYSLAVGPSSTCVNELLGRDTSGFAADGCSVLIRVLGVGVCSRLA